jgi:pyruvate dehydrogenase E2 component (dihydrolipoyllysine-residue acetyltransferase)
MAIRVAMPALKMAQETGKVISWLKRERETVARGEFLLEVETDKAVTEVESPGKGILGAVKSGAGAEVPVGQTHRLGKLRCSAALSPIGRVPADFAHKM